MFPKVCLPTKIIDHLGFTINSEEMTVTMTSEKTDKISEIMKNCLQSKSHTIRQIASVIGKINATRPANRMEQFFTKRMEMDKIKALKISKFDYDANMTLSEGSQQDLEWVLKNLRGVSASIN